MLISAVIDPNFYQNRTRYKAEWKRRLVAVKQTNQKLALAMIP